MTMTAELRDQALRVAGSLEPETMTGVQAAAAVRDLATAEHATAAALLFAALRVARTDAWRGHGHATAADWLAAQLGCSVREATAHLRTAKQAEDLPKTKEKMRHGDLSPDQAGAVADAATADPDAEDELLDSAARDTNKNLKDKAAKKKAAATDSKERERRIRSRRSLRFGTDADGAMWGRFYGPGADAAAFKALLAPFEELMFRHGRTDGVRDSFENRSYDALMAMLAHYAHLASGGGTPGPGPAPESAPTPDPEPGPDSEPDPATNSGPVREDHAGVDGTDPAPEPTAPTRPARDPAPAHDASAETAGSPPPTGSPPVWRPPWDPARVVPLPAKLPGGNNTKVIVLVDHTALLRGHTLAGETCEITGVGPVSVDAVRDILLADPFLAVVVRKGRDVVNVAHHGRGLNAHQRTAIEATGLRCTNQACNHTIAIQIDHRHPYAADPITKLDNTDPLCPTCHQLKTHHHWHLEDGTGPRRFLPPDHPDHAGRSGPPSTGSRAAGAGGVPPDPNARPASSGAWARSDRHGWNDHPFPDAPPPDTGAAHQRPRRIEQPTLC